MGAKSLLWVPHEGQIQSEELATGNFHDWWKMWTSMKLNELHRWQILGHTAELETYRILEQQKKISLSHAEILSKSTCTFSFKTLEG